jgi:hypothetical protein
VNRPLEVIVGVARTDSELSREVVESRFHGAPLLNDVLPNTFFQRPAAKVARD